MVKSLTLKQLSAVERAKRIPELRPILFQKAVGLAWWDQFMAAGFINPGEIPPPVPAKEPGYISIPFWPITEFLVATSSELKLAENEDFADDFLNFIRESTAAARAGDFGNYRAWMQFSKVLCNIPVAKVTMQDLQMVNYWLDDACERGLVGDILSAKWMPHLLERQTDHSKKLALGLLESLFRTKKFTKKSNLNERVEVALNFDGWHSKRIVKSTAELVGRSIGLESVSFFHRRLCETLTDLGNDSWSSIWRSAIEDHEQNQRADDVSSIFIEGLRDSLLVCAESSQEGCQRFVNEILGSQLETVKRVAIYSIDQGFSALKILYPKVLSPQYFTDNYRHEVWHLLHNHFLDFSEEEKARVDLAIQSITVLDEDGLLLPEATAYKRSLWLSAVHTYDENFAEKYRNCIALSGSTPKHPDFASYMSVGWVGDESPVPIEELRLLTIDQLVISLKNYVDPNSPRQPAIDGLSKAFRALVKSDPLRFKDCLLAFLHLDLAYSCVLIESYAELWSEKAQLPWGALWKSILAFCKALIEREDFWNKADSSERQRSVENRHWLVSSVSRLIESGVKSDKNAMPEEFTSECESILKLFLIRQEPEDFPEGSDAVFIAINSPRGRAIEALINLALRSARLADKECRAHAEVWTHFEPIFAAEMERAKAGEFEFATLLVNYLPNFLYLSKTWTLSRLGEIFDVQNSARWLCGMQAYAYVDNVYEEVYRFLKHGDHFLAALDTPVLHARVSEKIVQNIAVAYLNDFEALNDKTSLMHKLLTRARTTELVQLIWFMWSIRADRNSKLEQKILELWPAVLDKIDVNSQEGRKLASKLCDWSVFIYEVNAQTRPLLSAVVSYAEDDYNSYEILESIARFSSTQPEEAYQLWLKLLVNAQPGFPDKAIQTALTNIFKNGSEGQRNAKNIVGHYLRAGNQSPHNFLQSLEQHD